MDIMYVYIFLLTTVVGQASCNAIGEIFTLIGQGLNSFFPTYMPYQIPVLSTLQKFFLRKTDDGQDIENDDDRSDSLGDTGSFYSPLGMDWRTMKSLLSDMCVFLAETISNTLKKPSPRTHYDHIPFAEKLLERSAVSRMLSTMQDSKLMDNVLTEVDGRLSILDDECAQQLLCRIEPVIRGMQTSLKDLLKQTTSSKQKNPQPEKFPRGDVGAKEERKDENVHQSFTLSNLTPMERLTFYLPSMEEFNSASEPCKRRFPRC